MRYAWNKTYGLSQSTEYKSWLAMTQRCNNPKDPAYHNYGARGIMVCSRWAEFEVFLQDMGPKPTGTSLDRKDVNGNYEPSNCRWATKLEQTNNTRVNVRLEMCGAVKTVAEWCREYNIADAAVRKRLARGWSLERALTEPLKSKSFIAHVGHD